MKTSIAVRVESADDVALGAAAVGAEEVGAAAVVVLPLGGVLVSLMLMGPLRTIARSAIFESTPC